jgi:3-phenylpropionate/trans-cinnamate dioxygenase subunit alpha
MTSTMQPGAEGQALPSPPSTTLRRPAELERAIDVSGLVDAEGGLLDRALFTDELVYRQEQRRIFATHWLFLAHADQFHKPGDFFTTYMGEDPVIVTMDKNRKIRAFLNSCRHRGVRVCRAELGATRSFTCTYHGWAYDLEGKLISIPNKEGYPDSFQSGDWGLVEVPNVDSYHGLIFGNWDPGASSLRDSLGGLTWYLDAMLDHG